MDSCHLSILLLVMLLKVFVSSVTANKDAPYNAYSNIIKIVSNGNENYKYNQYETVYTASKTSERKSDKNYEKTDESLLGEKDKYKTSTGSGDDDDNEESFIKTRHKLLIPIQSELDIHSGSGSGKTNEEDTTLLDDEDMFKTRKYDSKTQTTTQTGMEQSQIIFSEGSGRDSRTINGLNAENSYTKIRNGLFASTTESVYDIYSGSGSGSGEGYEVDTTHLDDEDIYKTRRYYSKIQTTTQTTMEQSQIIFSEGSDRDSRSGNGLNAENSYTKIRNGHFAPTTESVYDIYSGSGSGSGEGYEVDTTHLDDEDIYKTRRYYSKTLTTTQTGMEQPQITFSEENDRGSDSGNCFTAEDTYTKIRNNIFVPATESAYDIYSGSGSGSGEGYEVDPSLLDDEDIYKKITTNFNSESTTILSEGSGSGSGEGYEEDATLIDNEDIYKTISRKYVSTTPSIRKLEQPELSFNEGSGSGSGNGFDGDEDSYTEIRNNRYAPKKESVSDIHSGSGIGSREDYGNDKSLFDEEGIYKKNSKKDNYIPMHFSPISSLGSTDNSRVKNQKSKYKNTNMKYMFENNDFEFIDN